MVNHLVTVTINVLMNMVMTYKQLELILDDLEEEDEEEDEDYEDSSVYIPDEDFSDNYDDIDPDCESYKDVLTKMMLCDTIGKHSTKCIFLSSKV
jgi:hypothetical protein